MPFRIAVASSDGKVINRHFGHADRFLIVDIGDDSYSFVETRFHEPVCSDHQHDSNTFDSIIELLSDCQGVFVSRIGPAAARYLISAGIRVFEAPYSIDLVLDKLVRVGILETSSEPANPKEWSPQ